jgi:hypothetical protein
MTKPACRVGEAMGLLVEKGSQRGGLGYRTINVVPRPTPGWRCGRPPARRKPDAVAEQHNAEVIVLQAGGADGTWSTCRSNHVVVVFGGGFVLCSVPFCSSLCQVDVLEVLIFQ